jgi:hypothetical protein
MDFVLSRQYLYAYDDMNMQQFLVWSKWTDAVFMVDSNLDGEYVWTNVQFQNMTNLFAISYVVIGIYLVCAEGR